MSLMTFLLNWHIVAAGLSAVFSVISAVPYILDILRGGDTRPNVVSWALWTLFQLIAIFAQLQAGASWSIVIVIFMTLNTGAVTILALVGYGYREHGWLDGLCLLLAVAALVVWQVTGDPVLAILFSIAADFFAGLPTLVKTYRYPRSEQTTGWLLITIAAFFGIISTEIYNTANLAYPIYLFFMNGAIFSLAYFGRKGKGA